MPRTFEEVTDIVQPEMQLNLLSNLSAYRALNTEAKKKIGDKLTTVLRNNFPMLEYSNVSAAHGLLHDAYTALAAYKTTMRNLIATSSPVYGEIFSHIPSEAFILDTFDMNTSAELQQTFGFTSTRLEVLLNYRNATQASTRVITDRPSFAELLSDFGNDVSDTARMIYLAAFTNTSEKYGFDKPLFQASVVDLNDSLIDPPVSFEPNNLYGDRYSQAEFMIGYSRKVMRIQLGLQNIHTSFGLSWVGRMSK